MPLAAPPLTPPVPAPVADPAADPRPLTAPRLRECHHCGQLQILPAMPPAARAVCLRCDAVLRHTHYDPLGIPLALNLAALMLLAIAASSTLVSVSSSLGQRRIADLFSGPLDLERAGMWELSLVVMFTTFAAPLAKLLATTSVLLAVRLPRPSPWARLVFGWLQHVRPWSMVEVYLLGVFVAVVRLGSTVRIEIGPALYALGALMLIMVAADAALDPEAVWEAIGRHRDRAIPPRGAGWRARHAAARRLGCGTCQMVSRAVPGALCPRCGFTMHPRKPDSVTRTWALCIAALLLYIPANIYPVLTLTQLGSGHPSTILGGVRELLNAGMWPLAALVFFASILVPGLKLIGLAILLNGVRARLRDRTRDRTILYRIVEGIGRWSMIDVFMISLLVALLQFGTLISVHPGPGAIAFAGVVILTMFAARTFDPRLTWDAAGLQSPETLPPAAPPSAAEDPHRAGAPA